MSRMNTSRIFDRRMDHDRRLPRFDESQSSGCVLRVDKPQRGCDQDSRGNESPHQAAQNLFLHRNPPLLEIESFDCTRDGRTATTTRSWMKAALTFRLWSRHMLLCLVRQKPAQFGFGRTRQTTAAKGYWPTPRPLKHRRNAVSCCFSVGERWSERISGPRGGLRLPRRS